MPNNNRKRQETLEKIGSAVESLQSAGLPVTRKAICKITGMVNGTLSQPYIQNFFKEKQICGYEPKKSVSEEERSRQANKQAEAYRKENRVLQHRLELKTTEANNLEKKYELIKKDCDAKDEYIRYLYGVQEMLLERLITSGVGIGGVVIPQEGGEDGKH